MTKYLIAAIAIGAAIWWALYSLTSGGANAAMFAYEDPAVVSEGQAIYEAQCASCHGADLAGQPDWQIGDAEGVLPAPPHDENGHTWHHADGLLFEITKFGTSEVVGGGYKSNMAGFGDVLSDDEIRATLAFIKSTWPRHIVERHNQFNAAAEVN
jgi:mono/diheme cytochrome c family protein